MDLGIFSGISADGTTASPTPKPFLQVMQEESTVEALYAPSAREELRDALAQALAVVLETGVIRPLGAWLDDEIVLAALERFGGDNRSAAEFLQTRSRNVGRWLPRIEERRTERDTSLMWQESGSLARQWILETPPLDVAPQQYAQDLLMGLVLHQCDAISVADRARLMGVSTPTYQKRLKQILTEASA